MLKKILTYLKYAGLAVLVGALVVGIIWANVQMKGNKCRNVIINITNVGGTDFVTKGNIINMLNMSGLNPEGKLLDEINTDDIEKMLNASEYIETSECVILSDGNMRISVTQLVPVLRVFDGADSYYLNRSGKRMRSTGRFHADVPIVSGKFQSPVEPLSVLPITEYVKNDETLRDLVTMYSVRDTNNIFIVPCIYGHVVNFGNNGNIANKFAKLKKFYREVMPEKGWLTYDTITLKWDYRVVASRRTKKLKQVYEYNPDEEEEAPSVESIILPKKTDILPQNALKDSVVAAQTKKKKQ